MKTIVRYAYITGTTEFSRLSFKSFVAKKMMFFVVGTFCATCTAIVRCKKMMFFVVGTFCASCTAIVRSRKMMFFVVGTFCATCTAIGYPCFLLAEF